MIRCGALLRLIRRNPRIYLLQLFDRATDQLARTVAVVHEALYGAQFFHLPDGVDALAMEVASRLGKLVSAFPHAQGVFGQAGVTLDGADAEALCNTCKWGLTLLGHCFS